MGALTRRLTVEAVWAYAEHSQIKGMQFAHKKFGPKLKLARKQIACLSYLSMALWENSAERRLLPIDWLGSEGIPNADIALAMIFCELANYCFAVIDLVSKGLTGPARCLVRSSGELSSIAIVLIGDRDAFREYVQEEEPEHAGAKWYKLFSEKKLARRMEFIERTLGLPERTIAYMREFRASNSKFFSLAVHHSFHAVYAGATVDLPRGKIDLRMLGGPHQLSHHTLTYLLSSTQMCLMAFFKLAMDLDPAHPWALENPRLFMSAAKIYFEAQADFLKWLESDGSPSRASKNGK